MAKFEVAILNDILIRRTTRDLMWQPLKPSDGKADPYALGWGWREKKAGEVRAVGHNGGQQGTSTAFLIAPDQRAAVVVLTNLEDQRPSELARAILNILVPPSDKTP
jgi:CubicO group peptidase (beta-lactamase class C family)